MAKMAFAPLGQNLPSSNRVQDISATGTVCDVWVSICTPSFGAKGSVILPPPSSTTGAEKLAHLERFDHLADRWRGIVIY